MKSDI